ncbi:MAG TPA: DUF4390 domain-containing protein [Burkholderiales bacterium]|nr:DUF4390 domain-containing protein [Burkholderiales bacterium]
MSATCARFLVALACAASLCARADDIEVLDARLAASEEGLLLSADFAFEFNSRLNETVANGVPLYFVVEFELTRPRWYWWDEHTVSRATQLRLSYHALSRQYRLTTGPLHQNFATLDEALDVMRRLRNWQVLGRSATLRSTSYDAAVRMRLDTAQLPRPLQVSALTSRELRLESPWKRFIFAPPAPPPPAPPPAPAEAREAQEGSPR